MGRINRTLYWALLVATITVTATIWFLWGWRPPLTVAILLLSVGRLHVLGRSGWPALGVFVPGILIETQIFPTRIGPVVAPTTGVLALIIALVGVVLWLGIIRGQPGANKFGPPIPGLGGRRFEAGR